MADVQVSVLVALLCMCWVTVISSKGLDLPSPIETCKRTDNECLFRSTANTLRLLLKGFPTLELAPTDPLHIDEMTLASGSGPVNLNIYLKNQTFKGLDEMELTRVSGEFTDKTYRLECDFLFQQVSLRGSYAANGRILVVPLRGDGENDLKLDNPKITFIITGHVVEKDGDDYVQLDKVDLKLLKNKRLYINLTGLFKNDKRLNDNMNKFLNENWALLLGELKPSLEKGIAKVIKEVADQVYNKVPYKSIHPVA